MSENKNTLIVTDLNKRDSELSDFETISAAQVVTSSSGGKIVALVFYEPDTSTEESLTNDFVARGADEVCLVPRSNVSQHDVGTYVSAVTTVMKEIGAGVVFLPHNNFGSDLAPRIAFRNRSAIVTGTENVEVDSNGNLLFTRVCYGGRAQQKVQPSADTVIVTFREKILEAPEADSGRQGELLNLAIDSEESSITLLEQNREESKGVRLESAEVVVAGGRGVGGPEGFDTLGQLADCLGGAVGASRVACDLGWVPHSWQVGLSGKTVSPNLYFAIGISGASHHLAGCGTSKAIVAINTDGDAPIFSEAKFGVVGEYSELIPALVEEFKKET